jgi:hypothetical protein
VGRSHGALQVQSLNVLPFLLQQGNHVVDGGHGVEFNLSRSHRHVGNGSAHTHWSSGLNLQVELNGGRSLLDLVSKRGIWRDDLRELSGLGQSRSYKSWNLLDQGRRSQESIVLVSELLNKLLVSVELGKVIFRHAVNSNSLGFVQSSLVSQHTDSALWLWGLWKSDGSSNSLISGRVIVLQCNLQLNSLGKLSLLGLQRELQNLSDGFLDHCVRKFAHLRLYATVSSSPPPTQPQKFPNFSAFSLGPSHIISEQFFTVGVQPHWLTSVLGEALLDEKCLVGLCVDISEFVLVEIIYRESPEHCKRCSFRIEGSTLKARARIAVCNMCLKFA